MSKTPIFIVDAFVGNLAGRTLRGNPAAVVILSAPRDALWMQEVAAEMNLSETAFLILKTAGDFDLRWFTPLAEVRLCGHATLASAHVLWEIGHVLRDQTIRFHTLSGVLTAKCEGEWIWLDFPAHSTRISVSPPDLATALGFSPREPVAFFKAGEDLLVSVPRGYVETLHPDFAWVQQIALQLKVRGIIVTSEAAHEAKLEYDFVSRFFAPAIGINEDPVTGSAHGALAPFWGAQFQKTEMTGYQASQRGGLVRVVWRASRVGLAGRAETKMRGFLSM